MILKALVLIKEGALILAKNILIILDYKGKLILAEAKPDKFKEIASRQIFELPKTDNKGRGYRRVSACWTNPVLCNSKIYLRNTYGDLVCMDLSI